MSMLRSLIAIALYAAGSLLLGLFSRLASLGYAELRVMRPRFIGREGLPAWIAGLMAPMEAEVLALGFEPALVMAHYPLHSRGMENYQSLYRHPELPVMAYLSLGGKSDKEADTTVSFVTRYDKASPIVTTSASRSLDTIEPGSVETLVAHSAAEVLARHRERMAADGRKPLDGVRTEEDERWAYLRGMDGRLAEGVAKGELYKTDSCHKRRLLGAFKLVLGGVREELKRLRKAGSKPAAEASPELLAMAAMLRRPDGKDCNPAIQAFIFIVSGLLFIAAGLCVFDDPWLTPILFILILFHEGGHLLAMSWTGCSNRSLIFIPGLGGAAMGSDRGLAAGKRLFVFFAGPLPGILLGAWLLTRGDNAALGFLFFLINLFNLLPLTPLDGGQIVDIVFFGGKGRLSEAFKAVSALGLTIVGFIIPSPILVLLGLLIGCLLFTERGRGALSLAMAGRLGPGAGDYEILTEAYRAILARGKGGDIDSLALGLERNHLIKPPSKADRAIGILVYLAATVGILAYLLLNPASRPFIAGLLS